MGIDVALVLYLMDSSYKYFGSLTDNSELSYNSLLWLDQKQKPTWIQVNEYWDDNQEIISQYF